MEIVEVLPQLHMVRLAFGQLYAWRDADAVTLIDCGGPGDGPAIADAIRGLGLDTAAVRGIVVTHGHEDHFGALAQVAGWHGATVYAHGGDAAVIRGERKRLDPVLTDFDAPLWEQVNAAGVVTVDVEAAPVDVEVRDGDVLDFGGGAQILSIPGHTPGSVGIYLPQHRIVFTGDTVASVDGGAPILGVFNLDEDQTLEGFRRLSELAAQTALFGHGEPLLTGAGASFRKAVASHQKRRPVG